MRVGHIEGGDRQSGNGSLQREIQTGRDRDELEVLLGPPFVQVDALAAERSAPAQVFAPQEEGQDVVQRAGRVDIAVAELHLEGFHLHAPRRELQGRLPHGDGVRQVPRTDIHVRCHHVSACRHPFVAAPVDVGKACPDRGVRAHHPRQFLDVVELHRARHVGQVHDSLHAQVDVGIRNGRAQGQRPVNWLVTNPQVEPIQPHDRAVHVSARVVQGEVESDVARRQGEVRIAEHAVGDFGAHGESRKRVLPPFALYAALQGERPGRLQRFEVVGIHHWHQGECLGEVRAGRRERHVERDVITGPGRAPGEVQHQLVEAELVLRERDTPTCHVRVQVGHEVQGDAFQIRYPGKAHRRGVGVGPRLHDESFLGEVSAEVQPQPLQRRVQSRLRILEQEAAALDPETAELDAHASRRALGRTGRRTVSSNDVPIGRSVGEDRQVHGRFFELHGTDEIRSGSPQAPDQATRVEHEQEAVHGHQRVPREGLGPHDGEVVQPERQIREVPEERQADAAPVNPGIDGALHLRVDPRSDAVLEEERNADEGHERQPDEGTRGDEYLLQHGHVSSMD